MVKEVLNIFLDQCEVSSFISLNNNKMEKCFIDNIFKEKNFEEITKNFTFYLASTIKNIDSIADNYFGEMKKLIKRLGEKNVIVSIVENGDSNDTTQIHLINFQKYLNENKIKNKIYLEHLIDDPRKNSNIMNKDQNIPSGYPRIVFYSKLRNLCNEYLYEIHDLDFSKTLIINFNDILFSSDDVIKLILTNNGNYDVACALDFYENGFYDRWVSFTYEGESLHRHFPYFKKREDQISVKNNIPVRVFSCWNGLNVYKASPFENRKIKYRFSKLDSIPKEQRTKLISPNTPGYESECTLLNLDLYSLGYKGIFINPEVKVAYNHQVYKRIQKDKIKNKKKFQLKTIPIREIKMSNLLEKWYNENKI